MGRAQERIRRKLENNPVMECNKVRNRYCPDLFKPELYGVFQR